MQTQALVIAAHGSHVNAASGEPARRHAAAIRALGLFDQVVVAFWKEFPSLRDVRYLVDAEQVYVVPLLMAEGYFANRVLPRELELDGPVTVRDGVTIHYTPPVGSDARMREVILHEIEVTLGPEPPPDRDLAVVVVGHGTVQNRQSKETVLQLVARLADLNRFHEVLAAFMEEPPLVPDIPGAVSAPQVVVVPLFAADGLHTDEDIPRDLGLTRGPDGWEVPSLVAGRQIWYAKAVGTDPVMVDVILERVAQARAAGAAA